jgi:arylformamidase
MIYDISVPIRNRMHVWPTDPDVRLQTTRHSSGDGSHEVAVTAIRFGSHTGTHVDAPSHMIGDAATLSEIPLESLVGPARVVEIPAAKSISRESLQALDWRNVQRVLFRTVNSGHWSLPAFHRDFVYLEPDAARLLVERGVRLVGIDYLSIDAFTSVDHATHFVLLSESVVVLEGLDLSDVPAGDYQLVALPLKLDGADGAPVRAILIK